MVPTLSPELLAKIERMKLLARKAVEGVYTGQHRSPKHGASIEFSEHKEYVPGDDIRRMDWRVFAKSDRYYIKRYEQETNLKSVMVLDSSASMAYGSHELNKLDFAQQMILAFSYILLNQSDSAGLFICAEKAQAPIPASSQKTHSNVIAEALAKTQAAGETRLDEWLENVLAAAGKPSFLMIFSDFLYDETRIIKALKILSARHHEVMVFHTLDPNELGFPFSLRTRFLDMEIPRELTLDPLAVKMDYLKQMEIFINRLKMACRENGIEYHLCDTSLPLEKHLFDFFSARDR